MEIVMLKGLEWRVTSATKLDYVELMLDCTLPRLTAASDDTLNGIRDLTSLQIQLSDFYAVYSNSMQSMVALAAAMNAYEVKKDQLTECDREVFRCLFREILSRYDRDAVNGIMDKLCRLVDPSSKRPSNGLLGESTEGAHPYPSPKSSTDIHTTSCEESSLETFDAALQTVEDINFNWLPQHFLCCGSIPISDSVMEGDAAEMKPKQDGNADGSPGGFGKSQSFDSRGSVKASRKRESAKPSPTSIATMLFGKGL